MPKGEVLTNKQRLFIEAMLKEPNLGTAARAAGCKGSEKAVSLAGLRMSRLPLVAAELDKRRQVIQANTDINVIRTLQELGIIGFSDPAKMFDENGNMLHLMNMPEEMRRAISSVEITTEADHKPSALDEDGECEDEVIRTETTVTKVKMWDKNKALETIAKHLGMLVDLKLKRTEKTVNYVVRMPERAKSKEEWAKTVKAEKVT
ncbi:Terminase small subunit [uncultured Caudovirales phage]|uniref:Terminase small subunit n=1 Tax=uncultured Caudovirales phage TaxID=2100421 RepID=A0A6J7VL50_9CAUD|nr:Terminase small subunit [uncultured Caudovirales phage]